ncbi:hypothetical protein SAMN05421837_111282 [Amycolatopsis pretoriensis]|uniref:Uncharacterized protein n=1 Tax=Amycolatopsis pretoriensis TaxID=218821 RepID=A0A1H5RHA7_9PSEU|nr:hypothetical protein [Amycolatopsis pretoriensis]SEF36861.1 hypothetical protein SAMN05421837_111282 [Amycolatopsis pretoriensis]
MSPEFSADPVRNRARHELLTKLAASTANPAAAEMARELLAGNVTPRGILSTNLYADVLAASTPGFAEWYGSLSEGEKDAQAEAGRNALTQLAAPEAKPAPPRRSDAVDDEEDFSEVDWLDG